MAPEELWSRGLAARGRQLRAHILNHKQEAEMNLEVVQGFKLQKPAPSDLFPPTRLPLPNLPKQHHQLGTRCSNT